MGIGILELFCCCDLDLDLMTFIYELDQVDPYSGEMYTECANINLYVTAFESYSRIGIHTYIQNRTKL